MKDLVSSCPIEEVMQVLSGRWPTLLIYYLNDGTKRFSELRRDNPTISHKMLAFELRRLEDAGIVERTEFEGYPLRVEYDLTPADLIPGLRGAARRPRQPPLDRRRRRRRRWSPPTSRREH